MVDGYLMHLPMTNNRTVACVCRRLEAGRRTPRLVARAAGRRTALMSVPFRCATARGQNKESLISPAMVFTRLGRTVSSFILGYISLRSQARGVKQH